jgi:hypothetical protein
MELKVRKIFSIVSLLIFAALLYGVFIIVSAATRVLTSLDSDIAVAIIAAAATAFVSVLSIVLAKAYEARALVRKEHREKKTPIYEDLIKFMFRTIMGTKTGNIPSEKETLDFLTDYTQRIMVWGSDDVLAAWVKWNRTSANIKELRENPINLMLLFEQLILTIRRDLGHKNINLHTGDLLSLFINDIDQQLKGKIS